MQAKDCVFIILDTDRTSGSSFLLFFLYNSCLDVLNFHMKLCLHLTFPKQVTAISYNIVEWKKV